MCRDFYWPEVTVREVLHECRGIVGRNPPIIPRRRRTVLMTGVVLDVLSVPVPTASVDNPNPTIPAAAISTCCSFAQFLNGHALRAYRAIQPVRMATSIAGSQYTEPIGREVCQGVRGSGHTLRLVLGVRGNGCFLPGLARAFLKSGYR